MAFTGLVMDGDGTLFRRAVATCVHLFGPGLKLPPSRGGCPEPWQEARRPEMEDLPDEATDVRAWKEEIGDLVRDHAGAGRVPWCSGAGAGWDVALAARAVESLVVAPRPDNPDGVDSAMRLYVEIPTRPNSVWLPHAGDGPDVRATRHLRARRAAAPTSQQSRDGRP